MLNVQVIGNLGSDAVIREFNGKKYVAFSVAHEKFTKDSQGNKVKVPVWISVLWYGEGGNVFPLLKSGVKVFVHGREDDIYVSSIRKAKYIFKSGRCDLCKT